jgi:hypothetical protein
MNRLKVILENTIIINLVTTVFFIVSVLLSFVALSDETLFTMTLSSIGNKNRAWFLIFSVSMCLSFSINILVFVHKSMFKFKKISFLFMILTIGLILGMLQSLIIDYSVRVLHRILSAAFAGYSITLSLILFILSMFLNYKKHTKQFIFALLSIVSLLSVGLANLVVINKIGLIAFYELLIVYVLLLTSFVIQFMQEKNYNKKILSEEMVDDAR